MDLGTYDPELLWTAIQRFPLSEAAMLTLANYWKVGGADYGIGFLREQITKALVRYIYRQFGLAS
jgi:hypothetical protein